MAREAHERDDLLRDARALVPRIMLRLEIEGRSVDVLAGFRGEALSLYFGDDPAFHFNTRGELRRAFVDDRLIKAESGSLVSLSVSRSAKGTEFEARPLDQSEQHRLLAELESRMRTLAAALAVRRCEVLGQKPEESDALARLEHWLANREAIRIARSPRVSG